MLEEKEHKFSDLTRNILWLLSKKEKIYQIAAYKLRREQVKSITFRYVLIKVSVPCDTETYHF